MKTLRKQISSMIVAMGLLITSCSWAIEVYRDFTDVQGRTIQGPLMDFDDALSISSRLKECSAAKRK